MRAPILIVTIIAAAGLATACQGDFDALTSKPQKDFADSTAQFSAHALSPSQNEMLAAQRPDATADDGQPKSAQAPNPGRAEVTTAPDAASAPASAASSPCDASIIKALMTPIQSDPSPVRLNCRATLPKGAVVTRQVLFEGATASGAALDCSGGMLKGFEKGGDREPLVIRSKRTPGGWSRPVGVAVKNCVIDGGVRIYGLGRTGEGEYVKQSSMNADHTAFAQASAPQGTTLRNVEIRVDSRTALYAGPGVTNTSLLNSKVEGTTTSVAVYLDAESAGAKIKGNTFDIGASRRELIAIDGSARNQIEKNRFNAAANGGIFLYRNCGEGGTIRHQTPQFNRIEGNTFDMQGSKKPAVWLNSRNGNRNYCFQDPQHPFGSSLTPLDLAKHNVVEDNRVLGEHGDGVRNDDPTNRIENNDD
jgi:hypothetical protein